MNVPSKKNCLTRRQIEVLELAMGGWTTSQIASRLGMSDLTVQTHFSDMMNKTGMSGRGEVAAFAIAHPDWVGWK